MGFPKHLVVLLQRLYTDQLATIRWNNQHCDLFPIKKGVRQECILSPHLFSIYTEQVMRAAQIEEMGLNVGGHNITNLRYADDTALTTNSLENMRELLNRVNDAGKLSRLKLNAKKTKVMNIGRTQNHPITIDGEALEIVDHFKYLGCIKSSDGTCTKDFIARIGMAKQRLVQLNNIWKDRAITTILKLKILKTQV